MPKRGSSIGALIWASLSRSEVEALDAHIRGHNTILNRLRGRGMSRSAFLADLVSDSLVEWAYPADHEMRIEGEETRVRLRLGWSAVSELKGRCDAENARRERAGWPPVPLQDVAGAVVRRFLRVQARQRRVEAPAPMAAPVLAAAEPLLREATRNWLAWNRTMSEELARRRAAAEFELLCDDPWCLFFAQNDAIRIGLSMFAVGKGQNPSMLRRLGFVGAANWLEPRVRVASGGFRR